MYLSKYAGSGRDNDIDFGSLVAGTKQLKLYDKLAEDLRDRTFGALAAISASSKYKAQSDTDRELHVEKNDSMGSKISNEQQLRQMPERKAKNDAISAMQTPNQLHHQKRRRNKIAKRVERKRARKMQNNSDSDVAMDQAAASRENGECSLAKKRQKKKSPPKLPCQAFHDTGECPDLSTCPYKHKKKKVPRSMRGMKAQQIAQREAQRKVQQSPPVFSHDEMEL